MKFKPDGVFGILCGIGGVATLRRLEKVIKPKYRFVVADIGILCLEAATFVSCTRMGEKAFGFFLTVEETTKKETYSEWKKRREERMEDADVDENVKEDEPNGE